MWVNNALEQLKTQVIKAKSYKAKHREARQIQPYLLFFEKYFASIKNAANFDKVIEYFIQVFVCCLNVSPNDRLYQCFRKLILWLHQDKNKNKAYYLIKNIVEICQRQFPTAKLNQNRRDKQKGDKKKQKEREHSQSKQRQFSSERDRKQKRQENQNGESMRQDLKSVLSLVRKSGQKNMLDQDMYSALIDYYLQRLSQQMVSLKSKKGKSNEMEEGTQKQFKFGSHILSELSTMVANKNKPNVGSVIQKHINNSSNNLVGVYMLIQCKNIPQLLFPVLSSSSKLSKLKHHRQIVGAFESYTNAMPQDTSSALEADGQIVRWVIQQILTNLQQLLKNQSYLYVPHLYKLYINSHTLELQNSEQLLNRLYIHITQTQVPNSIDKQSEWNRWKKSFISQHAEYIECTKIHNHNQHRQSTSILDIAYVIKSFVMGAWLLKPSLLAQPKQLESGVTDIIDCLVKMGNNNSSRMIDQNYENQNNIKKSIQAQYWTLYNDCMQMLPCQAYAYNNQSKYDGHELYNRLNMHKLQQLQWRQLVQSLINTTQPEKKDQIIQSMRKLLQQRKSKDKSMFEHWRIALQIVFQIALKSQNQSMQPTSNSEQLQKLYSRQAMHALDALNLNPPSMAKIQFSKQQRLFQISHQIKTCVQILCMIAEHVDKDELISDMKKVMAQAFDKVDQSVIRNKLAYNLFLSKCLLITNHSPKCRILIEEVLRFYEAHDFRNHQQQVQNYIQSLFVTIPKQILIEYAKYGISKDKLQMRYYLYQKQATHLQYILDLDLYDLAVQYKLKPLPE